MVDAIAIALSTALLLIPLVMLALRMARAQRLYLRLYQRAHPMIELPDPDGRGSSIEFFRQVGRTGNGPRAYDEVQDDPALEQLRHEVKKRTRMAAIWVLGAPIVFILVVSQIVGNGLNGLHPVKKSAIDLRFPSH